MTQKVLKDNFYDPELFPASIRGENAEKLEKIYKNFFAFQESNLLSLGLLNNIIYATGDNLRRIVGLIGFQANIISDADFKIEFLDYILSLNSNGSPTFFYEIFEILSLDTTEIDIWQNFIDKNFPFDSTRKLDSTWKLSSTTGLFVYDGYIDFLIKDGHIFENKLEDFIDRVRYVGRRVFAREVMELTKSDGNFHGYVGTRKLDAAWELNKTLKLNPFPSNPIEELVVFLDDTELLRTNLYNNFTRQEGMSFIEFDISTLTSNYNKVEVYANGILIFDKTFKELRKFKFKIKKIRWIM